MSKKKYTKPTLKKNINVTKAVAQTLDVFTTPTGPEPVVSGIIPG